ncbi:hypothetical protein KC349_g300 [Hortaea werneckii]|nr:hypothetical protein KC349_g300 [Hortaea werneckii]
MKIIRPLMVSASSSDSRLAESENGGIFSSKSSTAGSRTDQSAALICDGLPCIRALHLSCMYSAHARRFRNRFSQSGIDQPEQSRSATSPLVLLISSVAASPALTQSWPRAPALQRLASDAAPNSDLDPTMTARARTWQRAEAG